MLRWRKFGRIFVASGQSPWLHSHGIVAIPRRLDGHRWRIYFSPRDQQNRSNVSWVDIDLHEPARALGVSQRPVLEPGPPGCFDDCGAMGAWIVERDGQEWLYYQGWTLSRTVSFHAAIGVAIRPLGDPSAPFIRPWAGPLIDRCRIEPHFVANPAVLPDGKGGWRMWYQSGRPWRESPAGLLPHYDIRAASSVDGIDWSLDSKAVLTFAHPGEVAIARFSPLIEADKTLSAFYSYRGDDWSYRIGMATSRDGDRWQRQDEEAGLRMDDDSWERISVSYPTVFDSDGTRWILYNSGRYGDAGFGIAMLEQD